MNISNEIDMMAELFIDKQQIGQSEFWLPPESEEECLNKVKEIRTIESMSDVFGKLILHYRFKNLNRNGAYEADKRSELIQIIKDYGKGLSSSVLFQEGGHCERIRDYESAVDFYLACIQIQGKDDKTTYFSLNNLGFSLNVLKRFEEAEGYLREATTVIPERYNAWKNLGASLEWQGQYEESVECYLKAIGMSNGEPRTQLHLKRILERHPTLRKLPCFSGRG